jgi:microsomal dipeptidase-like Zn-dependent dipeptidase
MIFADLHCHPTLYGFNRLRNTPAEDDEARFHPWHVPPSDLAAMEAGKRAASYAQIDPPKMVLSGARLIFASITPIEAGFFRGSPERGKNTSFGLELLKLASGGTALKAMQALMERGPQGALYEAAAVLRNEGPARQLIQRGVMRYPLERIRFMTSGPFDYWEEFWLEHKYLKARDGVPSTGTAEYVEDGEPRAAQVSGTYHLIRSVAHLDEVMAAGEIAMVLTIEGGHTFTIGPDQERVPEAVIFERIAALKALEAPLFFLTLAHHFDNGICGHAHSIPDAGSLVIDQSRRMNEGLEEAGELGLRVMLELLEIARDADGGLSDRGGPRILLDSKHMSPRTRQAYYAQVIEPFNAAHAATDARPALPVIFSHGAWSGVETLEELIAHEHDEDDHWHVGIANAWGINLCAEDMRAVHRSGGLVGLVFEQRILGTRPGLAKRADRMASVVMTQLFALVDAVLLHDGTPDADKASVWDCLCLGTDYDGFIDPVGCYPTAMDLPRFADDLRAWLELHKHTRGIEAIGVEELVERICWKNAHAFLRRHLDAATPPAP